MQSFGMGGYGSNPMLGQIPSFMSRQTQPYGPLMTSFQYGLGGLSPQAAQKAQTSEFARLSNIQNLGTGMFQQQTARSQAQEAAMGVEEAQRRQSIERAIERGPLDSIGAGLAQRQGMQDPYQTAASTDYGKELLRQKRLRELELEKAEFEGGAYRGGGFSSWSTPAFPMMGR